MNTPAENDPRYIYMYRRLRRRHSSRPTSSSASPSPSLSSSSLMSSPSSSPSICYHHCHPHPHCPRPCGHWVSVLPKTGKELVPKYFWGIVIIFRGPSGRKRKWKREKAHEERIPSPPVVGGIDVSVFTGSRTLDTDICVLIQTQINVSELTQKIVSSFGIIITDSVS